MSEAPTPDRICVELVFSPAPGVVRRLPLDLPAGATVAAALRLARARPEDQVPASLPMGVFGQAVPETTVLVDGDRLELYRPLAADPKDARRERVERSRKHPSRRPDIQA